MNAVRIGYFFCSMLIGIFSLGFLYQLSAELIDTYRYPAPGKLIKIGGYSLHLQEYGQYPPTVVFEAGTGNFSATWGTLPKAVSSFAHTYAYDRAGLGWSDASPYPRTSATFVRELHTLLKTAGAPEPYILVGHSLGGGTALLYANTYPEEVYGVVLVDGGSDAIFDRMQQNHLIFQRSIDGFTVVDTEDKKPAEASWHERLYMQLTSTRWGAFIANNFGITRLYLTHYYTTPEHLFYPTTPAQRSRMVRGSTFRTCSEEIAHYPESAQELARSTNQITEKPLTVIANGKGFSYNAYSHRTPTPAEHLFDTLVWPPLQQELVTRSKKGNLVIAEKSGHRIQDTEPELIIEAVRKQAAEYRKCSHKK